MLGNSGIARTAFTNTGNETSWSPIIQRGIFELSTDRPGADRPSAGQQNQSSAGWSMLRWPSRSGPLLSRLSAGLPTISAGAFFLMRPLERAHRKSAATGDARIHRREW